MENIRKILFCAIAANVILAGCSGDSSSSPNDTAEPQAESSSATIEPSSSDALQESSSARDTSNTLSATSSSDANTISGSGIAEISSSSVEVQTSPLPPAGFYETLTINPPAASNSGITRCSFDGSEPLATTEPMTTPRVLSQNTVVRCFEFKGDSIVNKQTETYFINESVKMPVVAVSFAPEFYSDFVAEEPCQPDPCYSAKFWDDVEYPAHVEYFPKGSASEKKDFEIDAGASIMGGWSRNNHKKSIAITMRKKYQDGRLKYPLFDTRPENKKFKSFVLRNNGQRINSDFVFDPMATSLLEGTGLDYQRSRQVVVFYNGNYGGIYDMREKLNEHFIETNYGIDSKSVNAIKHVDGEITSNAGSMDGYLELLHFAAINDFSGENNEAYEKISTMMDMPAFADYMAAQFYYHNSDWPNNNVRAWRTATQPWKFMVFDVDFGFDWMWTAPGFSQDINMFKWMRMGGGETNCKGNDAENCFHNLFLKVYENPNFKRMLANHAAVLLTTYLNSEKVNAATDAVLAQLPKAEMERDLKTFERNKWYRNSCGTGFETDASCIKSWGKTRDKTAREEFYEEYGFKGDIDVTLKSEGNGQILLDGMKLPSANYTGKFFDGNDMLLFAESDGATFAEWEDGSTENPRLVTPKQGEEFIAKFK